MPSRFRGCHFDARDEVGGSLHNERLGCRFDLLGLVLEVSTDDQSICVRSSPSSVPSPYRSEASPNAPEE